MLVVVNEAFSVRSSSIYLLHAFSEFVGHSHVDMAFYATCNLRRYSMTNRGKYDSFILCERHYVVNGTDLRHVRFQFRSTCILVRIVDSESCQFRKSF